MHWWLLALEFCGYTPHALKAFYLVPVLFACAFASCSSSGETTQRFGLRDPQTLIVGRPADAISLDPGRVTDNESVEVAAQVYDTLLRYESGRTDIEPGLAVAWEVSADGTTWTFRLRRGVRFHDGTELNADAVVFSFERQRDPSHPFHRPDATGLPFVYWENTYQNIQSVRAIDALTVEIKIEKPYAPFAANMAMFPVSIVSPTAVRKYGDDFFKNPVGTGPFRFDSWKRDTIVLSRNKEYWGGKPNLKKLVFRTIPNGQQRMVALESELVDIAYSIPPDELQFVALHPELVVHKSPANSVAYLAMNTTRSPFTDIRVRRAVNMAVNKDMVVKLAYQGLAKPAHGPLPETVWGARLASSSDKYNRTQSIALLKEAADEGTFDPQRTHRFFVSFTPRPYLPDPELVANVIRANLKRVGVKTELIVQEFPEHSQSLRRGEHDICLLGWVGDNGDPDNFLYELFVSKNAKAGVARNVAFLSDNELDALLIRGQEDAERLVRESTYQLAQERIGKLAPWVPLAHAEIAVAANRSVAGIAMKPNSHIMYRGVRRVVP